MPNWCSNELHIFGASEDIKHFSVLGLGNELVVPSQGGG